MRRDSLLNASAQQMEKWAFGILSEDDCAKIDSEDYQKFLVEHHGMGSKKQAKMLKKSLENGPPLLRFMLCRQLRQDGFGNLCEKFGDEVFGVVFQSGLEGGKETLALYPDGEGCYIHCTKRVVRLDPGAKSAYVEKINTMIAFIFRAVKETGFAASLELLGDEHLSAIGLGKVRINFLTGNGIRAGVFVVNELKGDPNAGALYRLASGLLTLIVDTTLQSDGPLVRQDRSALPSQIKDLSLPSLEGRYKDGTIKPLFRREDNGTFLSKVAMDILEEEGCMDEILAFLLDEAKTPKIYLTDDNGVKFYIRDTVDENGKRQFLQIFYHGYTENLNPELKEAFKSFSDLGMCYGVAECENYYLLISPLLEENEAFRRAAAQVIYKHLPEGYQLASAGIKEGITPEAFEDSIKASDYERLF